MTTTENTQPNDPRCTCREGKDPVHPLWCLASPYRRDRERERNLARLTADIAAPARRSTSPLRDAFTRAERDHEGRVS